MNMKQEDKFSNGDCLGGCLVLCICFIMGSAALTIGLKLIGWSVPK